MNKKLKRKQALIMAEPYRTPFNSAVAKVNGDVIEDSVGEIKYATSFNGATKIEDANANKIRIEDGTYYIGKSVNLLALTDKEETTTNGITYSVKDGVITLNGTNSTTSTVWIWIDFVSTLNGSYSFNSFAPTTNYVSGTRISLYDNTTERAVAKLFDNEYSSTIELTNYECKRIGVACGAGQTLTNVIIKPILVSGSTIPTKYYSGSYGIKIEIADGVMTCNGNTTERTFYRLVGGLSGRYYSMSCFNNASSDDLQILYGVNGVAWNDIPLGTANASRSIDFLENQTNISFDIRVNPNAELDNAIIKPVLVLGSTVPTEFEPNFKNLLEFNDKEGANDTGITYSIKNGVITFSATPSETIRNMTFHFNAIGINVDDTYSIALFNQFTSPIGFFVQDKGNAEGNIYLGINENIMKTWTVTTGSQYEAIVIYLDKNKTYTNEVIRPILVRGSVIPTQFIPFANPYFVSLGQNGSVQYNGLEPQEIDLKGNVISKINNKASDKLSNYALTKNTKVVDLGSFDWDVVPTTQANIIRYRTEGLKNEAVFPTSNSTIANILCVKYDTVSRNDSYERLIKGISLDYQYNLIIYDPEYNTSDKLEAFKKAIRGTLLMYQVKNPTTINTTSFKTFKEDTNATISDDNFTSSPNVITETFKPTRSYDFKVNGFSNVVKSSNLLNIPDIKETTRDGVTYSIKKGVITLNGTVTSIFGLRLENIVEVEENQTYYFYQKTENTVTTFNLVSNPSNYSAEPTFFQYNNKSKKMTKTGYLTVHLYITNPTTFTNAKFYLMLVEGSTAPTIFEPYFDPYIESFADKKNLLELEDKEETIAGINCVVKNNIITLNGTATRGIDLFFNFTNAINESPISITSIRVGDKLPYLWAVAYNIKRIQFINEKQANITFPSPINQLEIYFKEGEIVKDYSIQFAFIKSSVIPTTFLPYQDKYSAFLNVKGKNLFDNVNTPLSNVTFSGSNQIVYRYLGFYTKAIYLKKGKYIFKSDKYMIIGKAINWTGDLGSEVGEVVRAFSATIELEKDMYVLITNNYPYEYNLLFETLILVEGDKIPEYEPYYSFTKEVLLNQPLRKFDYLTYEGVYRQTNEIVLDGTNNIYVDDKGKVFLLKIPNADSVGKNWLVNVASEIMITTSDLPLLPYYNISKDNKMGIGTNQGNIVLKLDDSTDNSLNNWTVEKVNNYFKQNPITITYKTVDQIFEATSLTRLLFKNGYNKITPYDSINNNAIVEYLEYYKSKGD